MGYREALKRGENYKESELQDVCVSIETIHEIYNLAFIEFETKDFLGVRVTRPDFTEGLVILNKEYVTSISIVYDGDVEIPTPTKFSDIDPSYE